MTDYFNFLGLPSVVQELITNEIVHNSIPQDRIQLALTSKYCNELVQRARPKKIIDQFMIWYYPRFTFIANSREYFKTKEQLMEILPNCQIKELQLYDYLNDSPEDYSEILDMLSEAAKFATKLYIFDHDFYHMDKIVGFYVKLNHLKSLTLWKSNLILPYYSSKIKLNFGSCFAPENFLEDLAKKSQNCPLSFFEVASLFSFDECQQFLQTAKFSSGADIFFWDYFDYVSIHLTYLGQNTFTLETFLDDVAPILSQKFVGKNRRILKLKRSLYHRPEMAVNIVSASNPKKNYFSGVFKQDKQQMLINLENVDRDEILLVKLVDETTKPRSRVVRFVNEVIKFVNEVVKVPVFKPFTKYVSPVYSAKMLESAFPTANFTTPEERVEKINNVLGTKIQLIEADDFAQTVAINCFHKFIFQNRKARAILGLH